MGDVNYSVALASATRKVLDEAEVRYDFDEDMGVFRFSMGLGANQKIQSVRVSIGIRESVMISYITANVNADTDSLGAVVEYITRANSGLRFGNFEVDYRDGEVRYKCCNRFEDQIPSDGELLYIAVGCGIHMWERYGNGFLKVLFGGVNPKDAIEEVEGQ